MKKRSEFLDVLVIVSGTSTFPLLILATKDYNMLGYAIVMILVTCTLMIAAEKYNEKWRRDYIKRVIRERKHS
jgi:hypothetical protein